MPKAAKSGLDAKLTAIRSGSQADLSILGQAGQPEPMWLGQAGKPDPTSQQDLIALGLAGYGHRLIVLWTTL